METEEGEATAADRGNRWYFFVPLALVGVWLLEMMAWCVLALMEEGTSAAGATNQDSLVFDVAAWVGVVGWVSLSLFYFGLLSRKGGSIWWLLGGFCVGPNLALYVVLLFLRPRRYRRSVVALPRPQPFGWDESLRTSTLLKNSFACEVCSALLNYGVSQCYECGERYRYLEGKPETLDG